MSEKYASAWKSFMSGFMSAVIIVTVALAFAWNDFASRVNDDLRIANDPIASFVGAVLALIVSYVFYGTLLGLCWSLPDLLDISKCKSEDRLEEEL